MDLIDRKIVACLQSDARLSIAQIADRVGLSQTPCWKRIQRLEESGVIRGRVALVGPRALGLGLTVFVSIVTEDHMPAWRDAFVSVVGAMPEVMDLYRMAGDVDYTLRVVVKDMPARTRRRCRGSSAGWSSRRRAGCSSTARMRLVFPSRNAAPASSSSTTHSSAT